MRECPTRHGYLSSFRPPQGSAPLSRVCRNWHLKTDRPILGMSVRLPGFRRAGPSTPLDKSANLTARNSITGETFCQKRNSEGCTENNGCAGLDQMPFRVARVFQPPPPKSGEGRTIGAQGEAVMRVQTSGLIRHSLSQNWERVGVRAAQMPFRVSGVSSSPHP